LEALSRWKKVIAVLLLSWQVGMIVYARFDDARYFCWAPHDVIWTFRIETVVGGRTLDTLESARRYRYRRPSMDEHAVEHLFRAIRQYETTYGKDDRAQVTVRYRRNEGPVQEWRYPEP
jgi:hypothetical protein